jgi:NAD(P)H-dependent FMN reductase
MKLGIIIGSTRPGRVTNRVAKWVENEAKNLEDTEVIVIDLVDYPMALFNEPVSPQYNPDRKPEATVKAFIDKVGECDAVALVTPEYNRSYSAVLKNALDYLDFQVKHKPIQLVAHGSTGGAQAISHLRGVLPGLGTFTTPTAVMLTGNAGVLIDETGKLDEELAKNPYGPQATLKNALSDLKWYSDAIVAANAATV